LLGLTCLIVLAQTYLFSWLIPAYHLKTLDSASVAHDFSTGYSYLIALAIIIGAIIAMIISGNRKRNKEAKSEE
jgi:membrane protein CcdC involved in cytochrome C biogenesis